ncbi:MAG: glycosyl transferase, partial [Limnobacter sp.]|nr:glycosyl transferase [Limnobacter sp.]
MADFQQGGPITTFHSILERKAEALIEEMTRFSETTGMTLILPCLYSELETPAMGVIVEKLKTARYLDQIVVGLDRASPVQYQHAV